MAMLNNQTKIISVLLRNILVAFLLVITSLAVIPSEKASAGTIGSGWTSPLSTMPAISAGFLTGCGNGSYVNGFYHIGNDYPAAKDTIIRAIGNGKVKFAGSFGSGNANAIFVQHKSSDGTDFVALYGHVNMAAGIKKDATVTAGQQIASVADIAADHLHFGIVPGTSYPSSGWGMQPCNNWPFPNGFVDPAPYLNAHPSSGGGGAPATHGPVTLGLYNPSSSTFYLRNSNTPGGADYTINYGNSNWIPLAGDWDANGTATPGVYDPSTGWFYLRNSLTSGPADTSFQYGNLGWIPIAGDWDGNGYWSIGLYNPATSTFYLRNMNSSGPADYTFQYGNTNWVPLAGDWDANGTTTIAVYDPATAVFHLNNGNDSSAAEYSFQYANTGWTPIVGDWDGNGYWSVGSYNPVNSMFYLRNMNTSGGADATIQYGNSGWKPVVGDWNAS